LRTEGVADQPVFLYLVDSLGFAGLYRPKNIEYTDGKSVVVDGKTIRVPSRAVMRDERDDDRITVQLEFEDAAATDVRAEHGRPGTSFGNYFVQLKGTARVEGRIAGRTVSGAGQGFFETYR
jgi:hypothetical protein